MMNGSHEAPQAKDVGILAFEIYYPAQYVDQTELEKFDNASTGKYTIGLGQAKMGFCLDYEDINSICLTALNNLLDKYGVSTSEIGRLDVGTETVIDKSKSVKSTLMSLFETFDVEGVDNINACFGGTAALFNAINWIESSSWDGRYAAVVMGDIAVYSKGNARPTGGAGSIALLIGPNAPLKFETGLRSLHISHAYDFYKPVLDSEYPVVDGKLSIACYVTSLDQCYSLFKKKFSRKHLNDNNNNHKVNSNTMETNEFNLMKANGFVFHSPFCKLVQKSFSRLVWNDYLSNVKYLGSHEKATLDKYKDLTLEETYSSKELEKELLKLSETLFKSKTKPSLLFSNLVGNMYTPSLYSCLASYLISMSKEELTPTADNPARIILFSYGSGFASAMFSLVVNPQTNQRFTLEKILNNLNESKRTLEQKRVAIEPRLFDSYLKHRETYNKKAPREPSVCLDSVYPGTWYLTSVDEMYRRKYERKPIDAQSPFDCQKAADNLNEMLNKIEN